VTIPLTFGDTGDRLFDIKEPKKYSSYGDFVLDAYLSSAEDDSDCMFEHDKLIWFSKLRD
jgi:hypothetical protein